MEYKVLYKPLDKVTYVNSDIQLTVMGYEIRGDIVRYICLKDGVTHTCAPVELTPCTDCQPIGFTITKE